MKLLLLTLAALLVATVASAQTLTIEYFAPGVNSQLPASLPIQSNVLAASVPVCGQVPPVVPATVVNPGRGFYVDPTNPVLACIFPLVSATIAAIPNGVGYTSTLTALDTLGQSSGRSAASNPFSRQAAPSAPTGFKVVQRFFGRALATFNGPFSVKRPSKGWSAAVPMTGVRERLVE